MLGLEIQAIPEDNTHPIGSPRDGVAFFVARMFEEHPEWAVLALDGSAADLAPSIADHLGADAWVADAADRPLARARQERFLLQLHGHRWSLLVQLGCDLDGLRQSARSLSEALGARVVAFGYEQTGGSSVAQLVENGEPTRGAKTRRGWPAFFRRLDLFVPLFMFYSEGEHTQLILEGVERSQVATLAYFPVGLRASTNEPEGTEKSPRRRGSVLRLLKRIDDGDLFRED